MSKLLLLLAALLSVVAPVVGAAAHEEHEFEPLGELVRATRPAGRMLFFALPADFETASPYTLVPAVGRQIAWVPDSTKPPEREVEGVRLRAVGLPPPAAANARYLVPVLDGAAGSLHFAARRLDTGRLVAGSTSGLDVVPVYLGPPLPVASSSEERMLDAPVGIDAGDLTDMAPMLLVRRGSPSHVVFGVQWGTDSVALIGEQGIAVSARRQGRLGIAVAAPVAIEADLSVDDESRTGLVFGILAVAAAGAGGLLLFLRARRARPAPRPGSRRQGPG